MPNWNYDASDYNPDGHFTPIPPGEYRVRIEAAEETTSKAGNEMIKLTLAVSGMNSKLWYYLVFPNATDANFAQRKMMTNQSLGEIILSPKDGKRYIRLEGQATLVAKDRFFKRQFCEPQDLLKEDKADA